MSDKRDKPQMNSAKPEPAGRGNARRDNAAIQAILGDRLRNHYDAVAREPVPDRFLELLRRLDDSKPKDG